MKKKLDIKKLVLLNLPYVFAFYFVDKLAAVFRLAPGTEFIDKLTGGFANFGAAFANAPPATPMRRSTGWKLGSGLANAAPKLAKPPVSLSMNSVPGANRKTAASLSTK